MRVVPDVLPLPAGDLGFPAHRHVAASRCRSRRRARADGRQRSASSRREARHTRMNAYLIFGLLIALMLTGMPISIALGLTVLTFLFTMTNESLHAVALKLFTGIEKFEI